MVDHRHVEAARELHGAPHQLRVHHWAAVVGDGHGAGLPHRADGREFLALAAAGDGADGKHVDHRVPPRLFDDVGGDGGAVVHRRRVGHGADGGESTGGGGARAALDGFRVFEPGLAQMHVHVDEAGRDDQPGGVEHFGVGGRQVRADALDDAVFDPDIGDGVVPGRRVDHAAVFNEQRRHSVLHLRLVRALPCALKFRSPLDSKSPSVGNRRLRMRSRGRD